MRLARSLRFAVRQWSRAAELRIRQLAVESPAETGDLAMDLSRECEREVEGRWLAPVPQLPGVLVYASTEKEAMVKAEVQALRVVAEQVAHGVARPQPVRWPGPAA